MGGKGRIGPGHLLGHSRKDRRRVGGQRTRTDNLLSQMCLTDSLELVSVTCSPRFLNDPHLAVLLLHTQS